MSPSDHDHSGMRPPALRQSHRQHSPSAKMVASYMNRNIPSYCSTSESPSAQSNSSSSLPVPRYSPNLQPWRRQTSYGSLSFIPSPRPEQPEYTTSQQPRRQADCVSPFRSVRRMREPFQLRLPTSPACENSSSRRDSRMSRQLSGSEPTPTWRSSLNLLSASLETFGLLPSPPLSDSRRSHPSSSSAYFSPKPDSVSENDSELTKTCDCAPEGRACATCALPNNATDEGHRDTDSITNVHMAHSTLVRQYEDINDSNPTPLPAKPDPVAPSPSLGTIDDGIFDSPNNSHKERTATVSSAVNWVPDNFSYCQNWLQGVETMNVKDDKSKEFNRRKFQIVQVEDKVTPSPPPDVKDVKLAVASRTKPKLVDISRQTSPAMSCSIPNRQHLMPSTPDHRHHEISAFSPDTPLDIPANVCTTQHLCFLPDYSHEGKDDYHIDACSMASERVSSTIVCGLPTSNAERPVSPSNTGLPAQVTFPPKPDAPPENMPNPMSEKEHLEKWWDHEWTIDQLELSVKDFPRSKLHLTSPVIMFLRINDEKALIRAFRKIFPDAAENDLDCLCAALIARNYFVELSSTNRRNSGFSHKPTLSRLENGPGKTTDLGLCFAQASPSQIKDQVLGPRGSELRRDLDGIVDKLLVGVSGREDDEVLKSAVLVLVQALERKT